MLVDRYDRDVLIKKNNRVYSNELKKECVNRVLNGNETYEEVSLSVKLSNPGILANWVKKYKENNKVFISTKEDKHSMSNLDEECYHNKIETLEREHRDLKAKINLLEKSKE